MGKIEKRSFACIHVPCLCVLLLPFAFETMLQNCRQGKHHVESAQQDLQLHAFENWASQDNQLSP